MNVAIQSGPLYKLPFWPPQEAVIEVQSIPYTGPCAALWFSLYALTFQSQQIQTLVFILSDQYGELRENTKV